MSLRYNLKPGQVIQLKHGGSLAIDKLDGKLVAFISTPQNKGVKVFYRAMNNEVGPKTENPSK